MTTLTLTEAQLAELVTSAVTSALAEVVTMTVTPEPEAPATARKGRKTGSKSRKAAPKERIVRSKNIASFGEAAGYDLEGWQLVELLDALQAGGLEDFEMPEGWAFGPASEHYLAEGHWPEGKALDCCFDA